MSFRSSERECCGAQLRHCFRSMLLFGLLYILANLVASTFTFLGREYSVASFRVSENCFLLITYPIIETTRRTLSGKCISRILLDFALLLHEGLRMGRLHIHPIVPMFPFIRHHGLCARIWIWQWRPCMGLAPALFQPYHKSQYSIRLGQCISVNLLQLKGICIYIYVIGAMFAKVSFLLFLYCLFLVDCKFRIVY